MVNSDSIIPVITITSPQFLLHNFAFRYNQYKQNVNFRSLFLFCKTCGTTNNNCWLLAGNQSCSLQAVEVNNVSKLIFNLKQNYPNPFNPVTTITFSIPEDLKVQLVVYDILGKQVAEIINEKLEKGIHQVEFNGSRLDSGIYFYQLVTGNKIITKKMTLLK